MRIFIKGKSDKISNKEFRAAAKFFAQLIMTKRMLKGIKIHINLENCDHDGSMQFIDDNLRPKEFSININNTRGKRKQLISLAHEMVHVKQYARGELKFLYRKGTDCWNGKAISRDMNYFDMPWEIEAFGRELGLYVRYIEYKKENKIKF